MPGLQYLEPRRVTFESIQRVLRDCDSRYLFKSWMLLGDGNRELRERLRDNWSRVSAETGPLWGIFVVDREIHSRSGVIGEGGVTTFAGPSADAEIQHAISAAFGAKPEDLPCIALYVDLDGPFVRVPLDGSQDLKSLLESLRSLATAIRTAANKVLGERAVQRATELGATTPFPLSLDRKDRVKLLETLDSDLKRAKRVAFLWSLPWKDLIEKLVEVFKG